MRTIWTSLFAGALCAVVTTSFAAPPQAPPQPPSPQRPPLDERSSREVGRMTPDGAQSFDGLFFPPFPRRSLDTDKEIAGLSPNSRPELLTWERVYTLALVRACAGSVRGADVLDPNFLAELAARHGVADFRRFRQDFLGDALARARHSVTRAATTSTCCASSRSSITLAATSYSRRIVSGSIKN